MTLRDLLKLVLSNLNRMRARVALTAVGVIIGTAAVIVLMSLGVGLQASTNSMFNLGDLTLVEVRSAGGPMFGPAVDARPGGRDPAERILNDDALRAIRALPNVEVVTPQEGLQGFGELKLGRTTGGGYIQGIDPAAVEALGWEMQSGAARLSRGQIVIGPKAFDQGGMFMMAVGGGAVMRGGPSDGGAAAPQPTPALQGRTLTLTLTKYDDEQQEITRVERLRVAGVFAEGNHNYEAYVPLSQLEEYNRWFSGKRRTSRDGYANVIVKVDDPAHVLDVQAAIDAMGFNTSSQQQFLKEINRQFLIVQGVLGGVGAIALLVAAFGIANTMTMAIYERTKEIGIMKAIGATNNDVLRIFLSEAGAIGFTGGVFGVGIGWAIGQVIQLVVANMVLGSADRPPGEPVPSIVVTPVWLMGFTLVFATLVGVVSGIYPALRAAGMKPLRALRTE
ncbi:hypothetical protein DCC79_08800 [bacterium]|nr:ABC transporter permease [Chloroflexi bacterium CFX6]RIL10171.1 MAG: hypothetical protein DCC79_08800 [bacterium]